MNPLSRLLLTVLCLVVLTSPSTFAAKPKKEKVAEGDKRELLSENKTVAEFVNVNDHKCMGLTGLCPDRCGASGKYANFKIVSYVEYKKHGEYGDPRAKEFSFQLADNLKNAKVPAALAAIVADLKPGDRVLLDWKHEYVTTTNNPRGIAVSSPERPVGKLEKITREDADKLGKP